MRQLKIVPKGRQTTDLGPISQFGLSLGVIYLQSITFALKKASSTQYRFPPRHSVQLLWLVGWEQGTLSACAKWSVPVQLLKLS